MKNLQALRSSLGNLDWRFPSQKLRLKALFLKGVASPYSRINYDLIEDGKKIGLLVEGPENCRFVIDLDKNPPGETRRG